MKLLVIVLLAPACIELGRTLAPRMISSTATPLLTPLLVCLMLI